MPCLAQTETLASLKSMAVFPLLLMTPYYTRRAIGSGTCGN